MKHGEKLGNLLETKETELISEECAWMGGTLKQSQGKRRERLVITCGAHNFRMSVILHMLDRAESAASRETQLKYIAGRVG